MCEFRRTPSGRFHEDHHGDGSNAPNCIIRVRIRCRDDFCDETITVVIMDRDTGEALTNPEPLECDDSNREYELPMAIRGPLQLRKAVMRFRCCGEEKDGEMDDIWVRCDRG